MDSFLLWILIVLVAAAVAVAFLVWIYAPLRAKRLAVKYQQFRAAFESQHQAIDAQFQQRDLVVGGIGWHYVDEGSAHGKPILFLHGLPEGWYSWSKVLPLLDQRYRLIAIDMKGYGRSDKENADYNWHTVAAQILGLVDSLGIKKFYLVSHDWGTLIGSVLVSDHPERILGYVRMEADLIERQGAGGRIAGYLQKPQWLLFQNTWLATFLMRDAGWFIDFVYGRRMTTSFQRTDRDYLAYEFSRPHIAEMVPRYFQRANWDLNGAIGKICRNSFPFPILQLQADSDPAQPPSIFADITNECPNVQIEWITNASHFDNFDQPAQVADAINRFVQACDLHDRAPL